MNQRFYPDRPWLGVGGIIFQGDRVLLIKRGSEPGLGQWSIPGGMVEAGETVRAAVQREIEEETGFQVEVLELIEVFERIIPNPQGRIRFHYVVLDYRCRITGGRIKAASDAVEAGFFSLYRLEDLNLHWETRQVIEKAYKSIKNFA